MIEGGIKKGLMKSISEVGKIKIGKKSAKEIKKKSGTGTWRPAERLDHFLITTTERGGDGNFIRDDAVHEAIKDDKPKTIRIRFPFDNRHLNFQTAYQMYDGHKRKCMGDGQIAKRKDKNGIDQEVKCVAEGPETCKFLIDTKCKPSGRMTCYLPDSPHMGGIYRFRTHGWNSVGGIMQALKDYSDYTDGILQGLPFRLVFTKKATEEHGNVPVVALVLDGVELDDMRKLAAKERQARIDYGKDMKLIEHNAVEDGILEDTDTEEDVAEEFYAEIEDDDEPDEAGASSEDVQDVLEEKDKDEKAESPKEPTGGTKKPDLF